jgi:hypothetical protein
MMTAIPEAAGEREGRTDVRLHFIANGTNKARKDSRQKKKSQLKPLHERDCANYK